MSATTETYSTFLLIRIGLLGQIGRFLASSEQEFGRSDRVVCRTSRGVEVGEVLRQVESRSNRAIEADGSVLRRMRPEDELLWGHLRQLSRDAHAGCEAWLRENGFAQVLLDVEPLLDGKTLYFHFMTNVDDPVEKYVDELVRVYEQQVAHSDFAALLEHGCGPGCGTEQSENGCSKRGGCSVCSVAQACRSKS